MRGQDARGLFSQSHCHCLTHSDAESPQAQDRTSRPTRFEQFLSDNDYYGYMPLLALCYIGNNLASSYCERVNSCAKLIMSSDRTGLKPGHLEQVCWLRMNRSFITYMKTKYPHLVKKWKEARLQSLHCS